jgi:hypothetical protein
MQPRSVSAKSFTGTDTLQSEQSKKMAKIDKDLIEVKEELQEIEQLDEAEAIDRAFLQMEILYKSRCVPAPSGGSNVVVRDLDKDS